MQLKKSVPCTHTFKVLSKGAVALIFSCELLSLLARMNVVVRKPRQKFALTTTFASVIDEYGKLVLKN